MCSLVRYVYDCGHFKDVTYEFSEYGYGRNNALDFETAYRYNLYSSQQNNLDEARLSPQTTELTELCHDCKAAWSVWLPGTPLPEILATLAALPQHRRSSYDTATSTGIEDPQIGLQRTITPDNVDNTRTYYDNQILTATLIRFENLVRRADALISQRMSRGGPSEQARDLNLLSLAWSGQDQGDVDYRYIATLLRLARRLRGMRLLAEADLHMATNAPNPESVWASLNTGMDRTVLGELSMNVLEGPGDPDIPRVTD